MKFLNWLKKSNSSDEFKWDDHMENDEVISMNESSFRTLFAPCEDVQFEKYTLYHSSVLLMYCKGLTDVKLINQVVLPEIKSMFQKPRGIDETDKPLFLKKIQSPITKNQLVGKIFSGELILWIESLGLAYTVNIASSPQRKPEDSNAEVSVWGPRDGFIEDISSNVALIRKRLPTHLLHYEEFQTGTKTKTKVGLLFLEQVADHSVIEQVRSQLAKIKIEGLTSSLQLEELIRQQSFPLFPQFSYTGRPDFAVNSLLRGRFVLMVDGVPTALIAPINFTFLLNAAEDNHISSLYLFLERILRIFGFTVAVFLPGFWIALITYHQEQFPFTMLATLSISRQGVPFPAPLECFLMLILFELFREAGARLPSTVGQTLSVVGGLIIGQAAISAGLTAPGIIVIVAISFVAGFTLVNQSLMGLVSILRFIFLLVSSFLGLFGYFMAVFVLTVYMVNQRSFGVPFLVPLSPTRFLDLRRLFFRSMRQINQPSFLQKGERGKGDGSS